MKLKDLQKKPDGTWHIPQITAMQKTPIKLFGKTEFHTAPRPRIILTRQEAYIRGIHKIGKNVARTEIVLHGQRIIVPIDVE